MARNTTTRDKHRAAIARTKPPCAICGDDIDYTLPHTEPRSFVADHIIPLAKGGADTIDNKQSAHRDCNQAKYDKLPEGMADQRRTFITDRDW